MAILNQIYQQTPGVFQKPEADKILLVTLSDDQFYFQIDGLALKFWTKVNGSKTVQEIMTEVCEEEKVPTRFHKTFEEDSTALIQKLLEHKLIFLAGNK